MIVEELISRLGFDVQGIDKLKRAAQAFQALDDKIKTFARNVGAALGRIAGLLTSTSLAMARFGAGLIARTGLITAAAIGATAALARLASATAKARMETIDSARVNGVSAKQLFVLQNAFKLVGASADQAKSFLSGIAEKVREGAKDGGEWADSLAKQGVKLKDAKGKARDYSKVLDEIIAAAAKMKDMEKRRDFLKKSLEGAPDQLLSQLLGAGEAMPKVWRKLVEDAAKIGGQLKSKDILDTDDFNKSIEAVKTSLSSLKDSFDAGIISAFAKPMRELRDVLTSDSFAKARENLRALGSGIAQFVESVRSAGFLVLGKVASAIGDLAGGVDKLTGVNNSALWALAAALGAVLFAAFPLTSTITLLLAALGELGKWMSGEKTFASPLFDAIAAGAKKASEAIEYAIEQIKTLRRLMGIAYPETQPGGSAGAAIGAQGGQQIAAQGGGEPGVLQMLGRLLARVISGDEKSGKPKSVDHSEAVDSALAALKKGIARIFGVSPDDQKPAAAHQPAQRTGEDAKPAPVAPAKPADRSDARPAVPTAPESRNALVDAIREGFAKFGTKPEPTAPAAPPARAPLRPGPDTKPIQGNIAESIVQGLARLAGKSPDKTAPRTDAKPEKADVSGLAQQLMKMFSTAIETLSPKANAQKIGQDKQAAVENDNRKYQDIGNDHRTISNSVTVNATGLEAVAAQVRQAVLGAMSTKAANTSTAALNAP